MKKLASESIGKILRTILLVIIIAELIALSTTIIYVINYDLYLSLAQMEHAINIFILISLLIMYVIYFTWMYKVHIDMQYYTLNYPIRPSKSVWSFLIPIYNLYGAWNVHSNLSNTFSQRNYSNFTKIGDRIMALLPIAYILTFADRVLANIVNDMLASQEFISDFIWLSVEVVFLALLLTYWGLYKSITNGVRLIGGADLSSNEDETTETKGA
ncbi:hypothetical protein CEY16_00115 [Halalkalibacillus sediminis]|uniref:DUF4328 domain-containing protein n=1 Tax=Halalkalibacillus sediminis TaxID=2018042 RepID=A0A2I0QV25_9BACI|nr:hypothetical protein [Halalkalibacillus sediminis]PKR78201.1 hypothetical protein CEY16_00115 [Halalkalibacillus sediminis]